MRQGQPGSQERAPSRGKSDEVRDIPVASILLNPFQPRRTVDERGLEELAASIREHGVLQPVLVRPFGRGYELVAGERRLRACKLVGLKTVPAVVRDISPQETALLCLVENLQREDLDFFDEAEGYQRLVQQFGFTQEALAAKLGKSQPSVANKLRLLKLDPAVKAAVREKGLGERHARALLRLEAPAVQLRVVEEVAVRGLTAQETEALVEELAAPAGEGLDRKESGRRRVLRVFKDIRIFLNSFREAVRTLQRAGIQAEMEETDAGGHIEVRVRIPKERGAPS
ncbi:MAG: ParB/RepB/Spo0J family partition protein [Acetobacteraceae bacterium]|nr:ParB/RepB/Spo0J family partition protein [Acetobacteraceae bacterium]